LVDARFGRTSQASDQQTGDDGTKKSTGWQEVHVSGNGGEW